MTQVNNDKITANNDEISLKEVIIKIQEWRKYLISKWKVILIAGIVGGILGLAYAYLKKPVYKAELSFALQDDNSSMSGGLGAAAGLASQFGIDIGGGSVGGAFSGDNILELLKSRSMIESTLLTPVNAYGKNQTLAQLYISFNKFRDNWQDIPSLKSVDYLPGADRDKFTLQQDSVLGGFYRTLVKKSLTVEKVDKKLNIINVKVDSKDELFSKYFAETLVRRVSDFYIETKTKRSAQNVLILQRLTDSVRKELNSAILGVASTTDVNPNPNPTLQILRVPSQHRQVDVEANTVMLTELVKNLELSKINLRKETPLIQVIDSPILPLEKDKLGKLMGIILGGFIGVFLTTLYLIIRLSIKNILL
jgi:hypothetical protein